MGGRRPVRAGLRRLAGDVLGGVADPVRQLNALGRQECGKDDQD
jgi:hypothetical protein